jgi:hypothetical protein
VVVAVIAMRMMETPIDQVIDMVAMRNRLMTTVRAVNMTVLVNVFVATSFGVAFGDWNRMFFDDAVFTLMMEMTIVKVINMAVMLDGSVPAIITMLVIVVRMGLAIMFVHRKSI